MWQLSPAAQAALQTTHDVALRAEITDNNGDLLATLDIVDGTVVEDETAAIRRACTVTVTVAATADIVPAQAGDLLHPLTGNELRLYRGVTLPGTPASALPGGTLAPLGVFRMSAPIIDDTGDTLTITVNGSDRSAEITHRKWAGPYVPTAGQNISTAIQTILNLKWTGQPLTYNMAPTPVAVPAGLILGVQFTSSGVTSESGSTSGGNDPWADCVALARSAGCELFFDRQGVVVMRPVPQPGSAAAAFAFEEGVTCTMTALSRTLDQTAFANQVIVVGTGATVTNTDGSLSPGPPVVATASSADPVLGPAGVNGPIPDIVVDDTVATAPQAAAAAAAQLPLSLATLDATALSATCNPALDGGDTLSVVRARMRVSGTYISSTVTIPLNAAAAMQVTNRSFLVAAI